MTGVARSRTRIGHDTCLKGFTGREHIDSMVLLSSSVQPGGVNEVQTITINGGPTGGTFTLTFRGATTGAIAFDAAASAVEDALEGLSTIGNGEVRVTGSAGGPYAVEFMGSLGRQNVDAMTASGAGLTGGTTPSVSVTTTTAGDSTDAGKYVMRMGTALTKVPGNPTKVREFTAQGGEAIIGISYRSFELLPEQVMQGLDVDVACVDFGAKFDKQKIKNYATHEAALIAWAETRACVFD